MFFFNSYRVCCNNAHDFLSILTQLAIASSFCAVVYCPSNTFSYAFNGLPCSLVLT